jgi:hypothetical protein
MRFVAARRWLMLCRLAAIYDIRNSNQDAVWRRKLDMDG